jgi:hypothetical protein
MSLKSVKKIIEKKYNELQTYSKVYNTQSAEHRNQLMNKHKEDFLKDPNSVDLKTIAKDMFYINGFHQADIRKLQNDFIASVDMAKEIYPEITFDEDVNATIKILKTNLPRQIFVVEDNKLVEIEEGKVAKLKEDFDKKGYLEMFEKQIKQILNA